MPEYRFETHQPVDLVVEFGKGHLTVHCADTTESVVVVEGATADEVLVEQHDAAISVIEPRRSGLFRDTALRIEVTVPLDSNPAVKTGSADTTIDGRAHHAQLRSGSGDLVADELGGDVLVETGSGDVRVGVIGGRARVKSGSGDLALTRATGDLSVSTGSGDVQVEESYGVTVAKTGSGDLRVRQAHGDVSLTTGSGDLVVDQVHRGRVQVKGASGDVRIGVTRAVPVWTDITTVSGAIRSELQGAGQPAEGQEHIEIRAKTVSGDIALLEVS